MKNTLFKAAIVIFLTANLTALLGCKTTIRTQVTRPAELDLHGANSISILPFQVQDYFFADGFLRDLHDFFRALDSTTTEEEKCADYLTKQLTVSLVDSDYMQIISAKAVEKAITAGREIPADVYITGYIQDFDQYIKTETYEHHDKDKDGNPLPTRIEKKYRRKVHAIVVYDLIESSTNRILASKSYTISNSSSEYSHRSDVPSAFPLLKRDLNDLCEVILKQLQPYEIYKYYSLLKVNDKEKSQQLKDADKLAKNGFFKMAQDAYYAIYEETDNFEAGYNAAILLEAQGELEKAEELMKQLWEETYDKRAAKALAEIYTEMEYSNTLEAQLLDKEIHSNRFENVK